MAQSNSFTNSFPPMQVQAMNGSSPQNAAFNNFIQGQNATANLSKLAGGKSRRQKYRGGQAAEVIPQAPLAYKDQSVPSMNGTNGIIAKLISISNQNTANAVYDKNVLKGGKMRRKTRRFLPLGGMRRAKKTRKTKNKKTKKQKNKKNKN